MFKNLRVRSKLLLSFGIVMGLYIVAVIAAAIGLGSVSNGLEDFYKVPYPMVVSAREAQAATTKIQLDIYRAHAAIETDKAESDAILAEIDGAAKTLSDALEHFHSTYEGDASLLSKIDAAYEQTGKARSQVMEHIAAQENEAALAVLGGEYQEACNSFRNALDEVITAAEGKADNFYESGMTTTKLCYIILFALAGVSLVMTIVLVFSITKGLTRPIFEIENAVKNMAKGDMQSTITYQSKDELGVLADNLRFVLTTLSSYVKHICDRLDSLANGDLNVEMDMDYLGEFKSIKESGNKIIFALNDTLGQIQQASDQVASGSDQVSSGAQALSQGATEQASSVEELAATINELSGHVTQTAKNARDINVLIDETGKEVENSNRKMGAMMEAMTKINESSGRIEKIIKTIEDIAFQTNILALNAAVEAARAGEAGKGFAVVADEVRSLASKSAEAAKDTTVLIGNSLEAVADGNQIAEATQTSLIHVVESAQYIAENMAKITSASDSQAEQIQQVTVGVDQISAVVQTNSATAEQSAAASQELFSQSSLLKGLVGRFRLKGSSSYTAPVVEHSSTDAPRNTESYTNYTHIDNNAKY